MSKALPAGLVARFLLACGLLTVPFAGAAVVRAACPPGQTNPITSGAAKGRQPIILSNLGGGPTARFFVLGADSRASSGRLPASAWLVNLGDLNGDGLPEYRIDAPAEGPGGWQDPLTIGCPSLLVPPRPPVVIVIQHDREDLDGDGRFDIFEDLNHNGRLDPGEDLDGDGRLTPPGGCEGAMREDVDCDGHVDQFYEDVNGNGILDAGEDLDGDRRLDLVSEDINFNGILDPGEDTNLNGRLDIGPYIEDRNHNQFLDDRPIPAPGDVLYAYLPDGSRVQLPSWYPYGSFVLAPGAIDTALAAWNGLAYDLSSMVPSTRVFATPQDAQKGLR